MKKFKVPFNVTCTIYVWVEAETKEEAIDLAYDEVYLDQYVGNGGNNKLIGVSDENMSVEPGCDFEVDEESIFEI